MRLLNIVSDNQVKDRPLANPSMANLFFSEKTFAVVSDEINASRRGRIYYQGTYWFAYAQNDILIHVDTPVELLQFKDNTWLVKPVD